MSDTTLSDEKAVLKSAPPTTNEKNTEILQKISPIFVFLMALATFSMWLGLIPFTESVIPQHVDMLSPGNKTISSLLQSFGGLSAIFVFPLVGAFSDRTYTRFGRRRPWIVGGAIGAAIMLVTLANANNVWLLAISWVGFCIFACMAQSSIMTLLPEKIPVAQRAKVAALLGLMAPVGIVVGLQLIKVVGKNGSFTNIYYITGALEVIFVLLFASQLRENLTKPEIPPFNFVQFIKGFWIDPRQHPDFARAWWARILFILGYATVQNYLIHYIVDTGLFPKAEAQSALADFQANSTIALLLGSFITGYLSDRLQRRKPFAFIAGACVAIGLLILAFVHYWPVITVGALFLGLGFGIYASTEVALGTQVLPSQQSRGRDMGLLSLAGNIPQAIAPLFALLIISQTHNYTLLFCLVAIPPILSSWVITRIKGVK